MSLKAVVLATIALLASGILPHDAAQAYTGPGLGLGAIGAALGIVGSIFLAILSLIWYPFKRAWRRIRSKQDKNK
jgi:Na+-driven multidrug efflux pump